MMLVISHLLTIKKNKKPFSAPSSVVNIYIQEVSNVCIFMCLFQENRKGCVG